MTTTIERIREFDAELGDEIEREVGEGEISFVEIVRHDLWDALRVLWGCYTLSREEHRAIREWAADYVEHGLRLRREVGFEPDPRSWEAVTAARRYVCGEIGVHEIAVAGDDALAAARVIEGPGHRVASEAAILTGTAADAMRIAVLGRWPKEELIEALEAEED